jgi:hypothetical protein
MTVDEVVNQMSEKVKKKLLDAGIVFEQQTVNIPERFTKVDVKV